MMEPAGSRSKQRYARGRPRADRRPSWQKRKIAVVAANGRVGQLVVKEAADRGFDVTAIVREENKTAAPHVIVKDALDLTTQDLAGFDAVVDAVGG